jgi:hypothetical protein
VTWYYGVPVLLEYSYSFEVLNIDKARIKCCCVFFIGIEKTMSDIVRNTVGK